VNPFYLLVGKSQLAISSRGAELDAPPVATATKILDVAEQLAQTRGFAGFSYADIAARLGVTKASLHYHFPSKAGLGCALIERYQTAFDRALDAISCDARASASTKLRRYVGLYEDVMVRDRVCLCGMLAAEYETLPEQMQDGLRRFFDVNERWLTALFEAGRREEAVTFSGSALERARILLGALEGAMLIARVYGDAKRFRSTALRVVRDLIPGDP
jgi:TetR/AcrR family transcriptional regulator, transcriptional repressor for nem operon